MSEEKKTLSPALDKVWADLVQKIESDPGFWSKPWFVDPKTGNLTRPYNPVTKRNYSGYNRVHLEITRMIRGYAFNQWVTFNQAKANGGHVNKGEKGTPIIVFNPPREKKTIDPATKEEITEKVSPAYFSYAVVFNIQQTSLTPEDMPEIPRKEYTIPEVEEMITGTGAVINHVYQDRAFYSPALDSITLPLPEQFKSQGEYYGTKFHELIHWTGHEKRLNRLKKDAVFGNASYSREELVAEIGAVFMKAETGVNDGNDNAAAYIKNWWGKIKEDKGSLITAAGQAEKALKFLTTPKKTAPETPATVPSSANQVRSTPAEA